jgi:putative glutamine amidotransferase
VAVGFADDGTLEAAEVPGRRFAVAVQWHPEDNGDDNRLFAALVQAAGRYRADRPHAASEALARREDR